MKHQIPNIQPVAKPLNPAVYYYNKYPEELRGSEGLGLGTTLCSVNMFAFSWWIKSDTDAGIYDTSKIDCRHLTLSCIN